MYVLITSWSDFIPCALVPSPQTCVGPALPLASAHVPPISFYTVCLSPKLLYYADKIMLRNKTSRVAFGVKGQVAYHSPQ